MAHSAAFSANGEVRDQGAAAVRLVALALNHAARVVVRIVVPAPRLVLRVSVDHPGRDAAALYTKESRRHNEWIREQLARRRRWHVPRDAAIRVEIACRAARRAARPDAVCLLHFHRPELRAVETIKVIEREGSCRTLRRPLTTSVVSTLKNARCFVRVARCVLTVRRLAHSDDEFGVHHVRCPV